MPATIKAVHPVLMARDVNESVAFFARLGFASVFLDSPAAPRYACVRRDGVELHLQWHDAADFPPGLDRPTYRFYVDDVDSLFADFAAAGGLSPSSAVRDTAWGTREFHLHDPAANGLQFYQAT